MHVDKFGKGFFTLQFPNRTMLVDAGGGIAIYDGMRNCTEIVVQVNTLEQAQAMVAPTLKEPYSYHPQKLPLRHWEATPVVSLDEYTSKYQAQFTCQP